MPRYDYSSESPYSTSKQTSWFLFPIALREIAPDGSDYIMTLEPKYVNRPDLLSYDLYGSPAFWWAFMVRNMDVIRDPIWDMKSGIQIWVPTNNRLRELLG